MRDSKKKNYSPIVNSFSNWPIQRLRKNRKKFMAHVVEQTTSKIQDAHANSNLQEVLENTLYKEKMRLQRHTWRRDNRKQDHEFWNSIEQELIELAAAPKVRQQQLQKVLLSRIVRRYVEEITGRFNRRHYLFIKSLTNTSIRLLVNAVHFFSWRNLLKLKLGLYDRVHILGHADMLRSLAKRGRIVIVPTHFSHLDSPLVGWVIDHLGLPPIAYGAGLNLFKIRLFAYFMHRLGTYKIDRRKKNSIYLDSLSTYTEEIIKYGCSVLFFPQGTRSRSGELGKKLKLGLLKTLISAQRSLFQESTKDYLDNKIYVVPVVINYHFVLEAPALIRQHLQSEGKARYYEDTDAYSTSYKIIKFIIDTLSKSSKISVSIAHPLDVVGNYVDKEGYSYDNKGHKLNTQEYFQFQGALNTDKQRENEYTQRLSKSIVKQYHLYNEVLCSHLVAFAAFRLLSKLEKQMDVYDLLRIDSENLRLPYDVFAQTVDKLRHRILELKADKQVLCEEVLHQDLNTLIKEGVRQCGMYHSKKPLRIDKDNYINIQDIKRLYYYHNRLMGYNLETYV